MTTALLDQKITYGDYLAWENNQAERHEFIGGRIFAMTGATQKHNLVITNLGFALRRELQGTRCRVLLLDMKLRVAATEAVFYPDLMVCCSEIDRQARDAATEPVLIAEILSPSTAAFDRREKFAAYESLPSLAECLIIDPERRSLELFARSREGSLQPVMTAPAGRLELGSIGVELSSAELFADID